MIFSHWKPWFVALGLLLVCAAQPMMAQPAAGDAAAFKDDEIAEPPAPKGKRPPMDYGPFLSYSVIRAHAAGQPAKMNPKAVPAPAPVSAPAPAKGEAGKPKPKGPPQEQVQTANIGYQESDLLAAKGITIRVGKDACVCFDTDMVRMAAGWTGGFLELSKTNLGGSKGSSPAIVQGKLAFVNGDIPGWDFSDPRPSHQGPLPREMAHYKGLYRSGEKVVLSYSVGAANVLELPGAFAVGDIVAFTRTIRIDQSTKPLKLQVYDPRALAPPAPAGAGHETGTGTVSNPASPGHETGTGTVSGQNAGVRFCEIVGAPPNVALRTSTDGSTVVEIAPISAPTTFKLVFWGAPAASAVKSADVLAAAGPVEDLQPLCNGGPLQWKEKIVTVGERGADNAAYVVDTLPLPAANPWNSWMRLGGVDFFSDGRAAVCTWSGDVWIVSGITDKLDHIVWKRYAAGMYETLGLKIVEDVVYVLGRDRITCLRDLNNDGEADFYESFNSDCVTSPIYHAFAFDLQTDRAGNFYYVRDGNQVPAHMNEHGVVFKISPDGVNTTIFATGFRAANGLGMTPDGQLLSGDNQGHWTPASKINLVKQDGYYGYPGDPRRLTKAELQPAIDAGKRKYPMGFDQPICWVPYGWDNSSGGQVTAGDKWGPLSGRILHMSYGKCTLFEVMTETVEGQVQGGVVAFPLKFESGISRARVNPVDGQVYLAGLKGWQSAAGKDGCLQRVRYTGQPVRMPESLHITSRGIQIGFTCELDPKSAGDEGAYSVEQYTYHYTSQYGSKEYKVSDPEKAGHDPLEIKSAKVSADRKSVFLEIAGLKPVMQMEIKMDVLAADGKHVKCAIANTINKVGEGSR